MDKRIKRSFIFLSCVFCYIFSSYLCGMIRSMLLTDELFVERNIITKTFSWTHLYLEENNIAENST